MGVLPLCMYVHLACTWSLQIPEEGTGSPRSEVRNGCKPSCECWELNPDSLAGQQEPLTAELSLQLLSFLEVEFHVAQAGLKINDPPTSTFQVLVLDVLHSAWLMSLWVDFLKV